MSYNNNKSNITPEQAHELYIQLVDLQAQLENALLSEDTIPLMDDKIQIQKILRANGYDPDNEPEEIYPENRHNLPIKPEHEQKIALALHEDTVKELKEKGFAEFISERENSCMTAHIETPDDTYIILYWNWEVPEQAKWEKLLKFLEHRRHSLITIDEDGTIFTDVETQDEYGCDEEFNEILSWKANICLWMDDNDVII